MRLFFIYFFIHILSFSLSLGLIQPYLGIYLYDFTYIEIVLTCGPIIVVIHHLHTNGGLAVRSFFSRCAERSSMCLCRAGSLQTADLETQMAEKKKPCLNLVQNFLGAKFLRSNTECVSVCE